MYGHASNLTATPLTDRLHKSNRINSDENAQATLFQSTFEPMLYNDRHYDVPGLNYASLKLGLSLIVSGMTAIEAANEVFPPDSGSWVF